MKNDIILDKNVIDENLEKWGLILKSFPRGEMGLTPDHIKASPQWKEARRSYDFWFEQLRAYNKAFLKTHRCIGHEIIDGKRMPIYQLKTAKS